MDKTLILMMLDAFVSAAGYFLTRYLAPEAAEPVLYLIGLLQPIAIYWIKAQKDIAVVKLSFGTTPTEREYRLLELMEMYEADNEELENENGELKKELLARSKPE